VNKHFRLPAIALMTTAMTAVPAYALSLNLGGDGPLVDLGNSNNADATVSVDTGSVFRDGDGGTDAGATIDVNLGSIGADNDNLGSIIDDDGDGGLINLGGNDALIDLGGNGDSLIDLGGDGDLLEFGGGDLLDLGGSGDLVDLADLDLGDGPLLDLGGIDLDGDLLDLGETGSIIEFGGDGGLLDLGGSSDDLVALDFGNTTIDADVNLDDGEAPLAEVTITTGGDGVAGSGVLPNTSGSATVGGDGAASVGNSTGDGSGNGNGGNGGSGGSGGHGAGGGNGSGSGDPVNGTGGQGGGSGGGSTLSGLAGAGDDCLTLTEAQLEELVRRHAYTRETFNSWAGARSLKVVPVEFCDAEMAEVAATVGASDNVARLQAFLAAQSKVRAGLQSRGYSSGDVIAADHSGEVLTVYVI
jgi:hypothetical protein